MGELKDTLVKIFKYIPELDLFKVTEEYADISKKLQICEWNPVVWIGRFFTLDNDYGEHWFDNWDERAELAEEIAEKHSLPPKCKDYADILVRWYEKADSVLKEEYNIENHEQALIVVPARFEPRFVLPYHTREKRKMFWTDTCKSLHLSLETMLEEAKQAYKLHEKLNKEHNFPFEPFDLDKTITELNEKYKDTEQEQKGIKIFDYSAQTGTFRLADKYKKISEKLNLSEEDCAARWIGRYYALDQDYGKLLFENWVQRDALEAENKKEHYIVNPDRFVDGDDGPCHTSRHREMFWRDVLKSLHFSKEMLIEEARFKYDIEKGLFDEGKLPIELASKYFPEGFDLEKNIKEIKEKYA